MNFIEKSVDLKNLYKKKWLVLDFQIYRTMLNISTTSAEKKSGYFRR